MSCILSVRKHLENSIHMYDHKYSLELKDSLGKSLFCFIFLWFLCLCPVSLSACDCSSLWHGVDTKSKRQNQS